MIIDDCDKGAVDNADNDDYGDDGDDDETMMMTNMAMMMATTWCPGAASGLTAALSSPANAELLQPSPYHSW